MFRQQIARQARLFSTTPIARKSPVETIKDAAKAVDRTLSGAAVKGIEKGGKFMQPYPFIPMFSITATHCNPTVLLKSTASQDHITNKLPQNKLPML
jgi:hypothetical protein